MTARSRRDKKAKRVSARRRIQEHKVGGGSKYLTIPDGYSFFQPKAGSKYRLDFMPYRVGKGNPFADEGDQHYERTFFVHRSVGANSEWHLCAAKTFGKSCPICEQRAKLSRDPNADEELIKQLAPSERQLWLPRNLAEQDEKLIWEFSFHLFGKALDKKINTADEDDEYEFFADPTDGQTVRVSFDQSDAGKWVEASDIEFRSRKEQYAEGIADEMPCLDDLLTATPYDKLKAIFLETEDADDEDQDDDDDDGPDDEEKDEPTTAEEAGLEKGMEVEHEEFGECTIKRISKDGTSLMLEDEDGDEHRAIGCDEVEKVKPKKKTKPKPKAEPEEDDDPPPKKTKPKPKPKKETKKPPKEEDDDEDEDDWDDSWPDDDEDD